MRLVLASLLALAAIPVLAQDMPKEAPGAPDPARAVARQSIERTSSPRTYSRSESNSVPCPRTWIDVFPSSSRSRAIREGRCLRAVKAGSTRMAPRTSCCA